MQTPCVQFRDPSKWTRIRNGTSSSSPTKQDGGRRNPSALWTRLRCRHSQCGGFFFSCSRLRVSSLVMSLLLSTLFALLSWLVSADSELPFCRFWNYKLFIFRFASWTIGEIRLRVISFLFCDIGGVTSFSKAEASSKKWRICYSCWRSYSVHTLCLFFLFFPHLFAKFWFLCRTDCTASFINFVLLVATFHCKNWKRGNKKCFFLVYDLGSAASPCCVGDLLMAR
jgi:hypothetical protein